MRPTNIIAIDPKQGTILSVAGNNYRILITGAETENAFAIIDMIIAPGGGPAPHAHSSFQESFYVIDGEIVVRAENLTYIAKAGAFVSIPKGGAIHSFKNETTTNAHLLCIAVAAGLEDFFKEIGQPVGYGEMLPPPVPGPETAAKMKGLAAKYNQEFFPQDYFKKS